MSTVKQKWAQQRNYSKKMLMGARAIMSNAYCSDNTLPREKEMIAGAIAALNGVLDIWSSRNEESRKKFLEKWGKEN